MRDLYFYHSLKPLNLIFVFPFLLYIRSRDGSWTNIILQKEDKKRRGRANWKMVMNRFDPRHILAHKSFFSFFSFFLFFFCLFFVYPKNASPRFERECVCICVFMRVWVCSCVCVCVIIIHESRRANGRSMNSTHVDKIRIRLLAEKFTKSKNVQGSRVMVAVRKREKLDRRKWFYFRWKVGRCTSRRQSISSPFFFPRSRQRQNTSSFRLSFIPFFFFSLSSDNAITRLIRSARVFIFETLKNLGSLSPPPPPPPRALPPVCALQTI